MVVYGGRWRDGRWGDGGDRSTRPAATAPAAPNRYVRPPPPRYVRPSVPSAPAPSTAPPFPNANIVAPGSQAAGGGGIPGTTPQPDPGIVPEPAAAIDFYAIALALYPWLPDVLLQVFADAWAQWGDPAVAFGIMRTHPQYEVYFAGNRRDDGSFRYTEQEYMAVRDGMGLLLADYGQNPDAYGERITNAIRGDVSVQEFRDRLDLLWTQVQQQIPEIRDAYIREFGLTAADPDVATSNIFASFLNPGASLQELRVRVTNTQIVGQGNAFGFDRAFDRAEELRRAGLTGEAARGLYQQGAVQVPTLSGFAARYYDPDDSFGIDDFESAATGLDPFEQERAQRLISFERANFTQRGSVVRDQTGALTGLQQV